jgi:aerobic carbon-monoxide dehydrogenase small subunit
MTNSSVSGVQVTPPAMRKVAMSVNGRPVQTEVAPRTHLADFLREDLRLTGTHLGCEHGVCGACTLLLDGEPVRSCITFAVACEGRAVTTIEGYDADPIMQRLRVAFTAHHALQCGFCTPGMLATARDIVLRLPLADERTVRLELSGNLCRCTGYMGIVAAIRSVLEELRNQPDPEVERLRSARRDARAPAGVGSGAAAATPASSGAAMAGPAVLQRFEPTAVSPKQASDPRSAPGERSESASPAAAGSGKGSRIDGRFDVPFPPDRVWEFMLDLPAVASCLPGASVESHDGDRVKGRIAVKFGPMSAAFVGAAKLERNAAAKSAVLRGAGQDTLSQSRATGDVAYRLEPLGSGATRVHVELLYALQGPLAQFSRSGLVRDFVRRMIADFGANVTRRLQSPDSAAAPAPAPLSPMRLMIGVLWDRLRGIFGRRG